MQFFIAVLASLALAAPTPSRGRSNAVSGGRGPAPAPARRQQQQLAPVPAAVINNMANPRVQRRFGGDFRTPAMVRGDNLVASLQNTGMMYDDEEYYEQEFEPETEEYYEVEQEFEPESEEFYEDFEETD